MDNILDILLTAHSSCMEHALSGRRYSLGELYAVERRHCGGGVFSHRAAISTVSGLRVNAIMCGRGATKVLAWSQMHGNEPISTLALADVMNFLESGSDIAGIILEWLSIVMIPLLNPEGHLRNDRRNLMGIDINRDAMDLVSPEAGFLMGMHADLSPEYALNLHDQELYHITEPHRQQTLVALLAPECDQAKTVTPARHRAMAVAGYVAQCLERSDEALHRVAKYQDSYTPTAFGDTFMSKGTSSVLIEAGGSAMDHERTTARRMVFASIVMSLYAMCCMPSVEQCVAAYDRLPINIYNSLYDIVLHQIAVQAPNREYRVDVGIRRVKTSCNDEDFADDSVDFRIVNVGNLSAFAAIRDYDASGWRLHGQYSALRVGAAADFAIQDAEGDVFSVRKLLMNI